MSSYTSDTHKTQTVRWRISDFLRRGIMGLFPVMVMSLVTSGATTRAWEQIRGDNDLFIGKTTIHFSPADQVWTRTRRSTYHSSHGFPSTLSFSFSVGHNDVMLSLRKNNFMDSSPPVYVIRHGTLVRHDDTTRQVNSAYYQDRMSGAAVMVSLAADGRGYEVTGSFFHTGHEYSIQPIRDQEKGVLDHVVYRLSDYLGHQSIPVPTSDLKEHISLQQEIYKPTHNHAVSSLAGNTIGPNIITSDTANNISEIDWSNAWPHSQSTNRTISLSGYQAGSMGNGSIEFVPINLKDQLHGIYVKETLDDINVKLYDANGIRGKNSSGKTEEGLAYSGSDNRGNSATDDDHGGNSATDDNGRGNSATNDDGRGNNSTDDDSRGNNSPDDDGRGNNSTDDDGKGNNSTDDDGRENNSTDDDGRGNNYTDDDGRGNNSTDDDGRGNNSTDYVYVGRRKRQANSYVVELLVVIDYGVYEVWYNGVSGLGGEEKLAEVMRRIKQFYSFVLNGIDLRYTSVQRYANFNIDVTWSGIIVFDKPDTEYWKNATSTPKLSRDLVEASSALEAFRAWAEGQGSYLPPSDHVMLFTGHNLTYGGSVSNAGLAYLGSACNPEYYFSIVEEYFEFRDVAIAAHELGHSLGARHDMDGNKCLSFDRYIMTSRFQFPTARKAHNPWLFSSCSVEYFKTFIDGLDRNDTNCLVTKESPIDNKEIQAFLVSLPGEVYAGDGFCRIGDGGDSYICRDQHINDYSSICYGGIYCYSPTERLCFPKLPPDGFSCGNKKWCLNGSCQFSELAPTTQADDCPFGDEPGAVSGKTCEARVVTSLYDCYRADIRARCCASCSQYRKNLPGCEFGDMVQPCQQDQCTNYDPDYSRENCCDTCSDVLYTRPTDIRATSPIPSTTAKIGDGITPSSKGDHPTSLRGHGRFNPTEKIQNISHEGQSKIQESEKVKDGKRQNAIRKQNVRNTVVRRDEDSEEGDSSDEGSHRGHYSGYRNIFNLLRPRTYPAPQSRDERMENILTFLNGIRRPGENTLLQRMRFLNYILDRASHQDLVDVRPDGTGRIVKGDHNMGMSMAPRDDENSDVASRAGGNDKGKMTSNADDIDRSHMTSNADDSDRSHRKSNADDSDRSYMTSNADDIDRSYMTSNADDIDRSYMTSNGGGHNNNPRENDPVVHNPVPDDYEYLDEINSYNDDEENDERK